MGFRGRHARVRVGRRPRSRSTRAALSRIRPFAFGNTWTGPEEFYQYALGRPTLHPGGFEQTITKPLDWAADIEHSEYMGMIQEASDPDSVLRKSAPLLAETLKLGTEKYGLLAFKVLSIFFLDSKKLPEVPFTALDSSDPRDLWQWMDTQRKAGNEVLAVSHNSNLSDGVMFPTEVDHKGRPIDRADEPWNLTTPLRATERTSLPCVDRSSRRPSAGAGPWPRGARSSRAPPRPPRGRRGGPGAGRAGGAGRGRGRRRDGPG